MYIHEYIHTHTHIKQFAARLAKKDRHDYEKAQKGVCIYTRAQAYTYAHTYINIYVYTYIYIHIK